MIIIGMYSLAITMHTVDVVQVETTVYCGRGTSVLLNKPNSPAESKTIIVNRTPYVLKYGL